MTDSASYHEAGHSVAAVVLEGVVRRAEVRRRNGTVGSTQLAPMDRISPIACARRAIVMAAGAEAERHLASLLGIDVGDCIEKGAKTDSAKLRDLLGRVSDRLKPAVHAQAAALVRARWPAVQAVAMALEEKGRLEGHEIARLVARAQQQRAREDDMRVTRFDDPSLDDGRWPNRAASPARPRADALEVEVRAALGPGARADRVRRHVAALVAEGDAFRSEYLRLLRLDAAREVETPEMRTDAPDLTRSAEARAAFMRETEIAWTSPLAATREGP